MEKVIPSYYNEFQCTASACSDNCCIGWEIDVDEETLGKYRELDKVAEFPIMSHIEMEGEDAHFVLGEEERCPFLNEENLCRLQAAYGEEVLCRICQLHPRFIHEYGNRMEIGLDLCCEEATRLLLSQETLPILRVEHGEDGENVAEEEPLYPVLEPCRSRMFAYMSETDEPLTQMMGRLLAYCDVVEEQLLFGAEKEDVGEFSVEECQLPTNAYRILSPTKEYYGECIAFLRRRIPLSVSWHNFLADVATDLDAIWEKRDEFHQQYPDFENHGKQLLHHYTYRYFMEGIWDGGVFCQFFVGVFMVRMIELLDVAWYHYHGTFSFEDQVWICTQMAKELEYSEENLEAVLAFGVEGGENFAVDLCD